MLFIQSSKKAFVLSIVLWIVAALLFGGVTLALLSKDTLLLSRGVKDKLQTRLIAEDIFELFKLYVVTANYDNNSLINDNLNNLKYKFPNRLIVDNRWYALAKNIQIRVQDTSSLLNAFKTPSSIIASLASSQRQERYVIDDSLTDWRDKDNIVSLNGAEASRYKQGFIRNSNSIQSSTELKLINGINSLSNENWNSLKKRLYYGDGNIVNLALVDSKYLSIILKINESYAEALVKMREQDMQKYILLVNKMKTFDEENMGFFLSKQFRIEIKVTLGEAISRLQCIISFQDLKNKQYSIIKYIMN